MKTNGLELLLLALVCALNVGCVVKHTTQGFQTNPPVRDSAAGFPHAFGQEKEKSGISKFFAQLNPANFNSVEPADRFNTDDIPAERDATSLRSHSTVSPELLIVAGEMALQPGPNRPPNFDAAVQYFGRAVKMDPKNLRANAGLARAEKGRGNHKKAERIQQALREWYPNQALQLEPQGQQPPRFNQAQQPTSPGFSQSVKKRTGIQQVSFVEDIKNKPQSKSASKTVHAPTVLQPEILFSKLNLDQRIANPFYNHADSKSASLATHLMESSEQKAGSQKNATAVVPASLVIEESQEITKSIKHRLTDEESNR